MAVKYSIYSIGGTTAVQPIGGTPSLHNNKDIRIGATATADTFTFFIKEAPLFTALFSDYGSDAADTPHVSSAALLTAIGTLMAG